ncbi:hypothetical protein CLAFUR4_14521 [Fulvia fulva]|nr:hypothetical protein CLAFUR4_14521 [Fulvia fulva]WPV37559.1 hypothetical protein CLAFUW7_14530 [Fulvia fulva]
MGLSAKRYRALRDERKEAGKAAYVAPGVVSHEKYEEVQQAQHKGLIKAGQLLKQFHAIKVPAKRKHTKSWLDNARQAKDALNAFWSEVRSVRICEMEGAHGHVIEEVEKCREVTLLDFYRDPEFLNSIDAELAELNAGKEAVNAGRPLKRPSNEDHEPQSQWGTNDKTPPKRPKIEKLEKPPKRRRDPDYEGPPEEDPEPVLAAYLPPETMSVSQATLQTLARLWPHQSMTVREGTVRWNDFQAAMEDIGMRASPGGGSKVSFFGRGRSIVIHAPHGSGTVQLTRGNLGKFGRRLTRHFGWTYGMFEERLREEEGDEGDEDNEGDGDAE